MYTINISMKRLLLFFFLVMLGGMSPIGHLQSYAEEPVYTTLRSIDLGTYNEYRYRMTEQFFNLKEYYEINRSMSVPILQRIAQFADEGYNYLPDNLKNKNYYRNLLTNIKK